MIQFLDRLQALGSHFQKDLLALLQLERSSNKYMQTGVVKCNKDVMEVDEAGDFSLLSQMSPFADVLISLGPLCSLILLSKWVHNMTSHAGVDEALCATVLRHHPNTNLHWYQHFQGIGEKSDDNLLSTKSVRDDDDTRSVASTLTNAEMSGENISSTPGVLFPLQTWTDRVFQRHEVCDEVEKSEEVCFDAQFTSFISLSVECNESDFAVTSDYVVAYSPLDPQSPSVPNLRLPSVLYRNNLSTLSNGVDPVLSMLTNTSPNSSKSPVAFQLSPEEIVAMFEKWIHSSALITLDIQLHMASLISPLSSAPSVSSKSFAPPSTQHLPFDTKSKRWALTLPNSYLDKIGEHFSLIKLQQPATFANEYFFQFNPLSSQFMSTTFIDQNEYEAGSNEYLSTVKSHLSKKYVDLVYRNLQVCMLVNSTDEEVYVLMTQNTSDSPTDISDMKHYIARNESSLKTVDVAIPLPHATSCQGYRITVSIDQNKNIVIKAMAKVDSCSISSSLGRCLPLNLSIKLTQSIAHHFHTLVSFTESIKLHQPLSTTLPNIADSLVSIEPREFSLGISYFASKSSGDANIDHFPLQLEVGVQSLYQYNDNAFSNFPLPDVSVWQNMLYTKVHDFDVTKALTTSTKALIDCTIKFFQKKVNSHFLTSHENKSAMSESGENFFVSPIFQNCNWFGILRSAAIKTLPLVISTQSLNRCLTQRNAMFKRCMTSSANGQLQHDAELLCEQAYCADSMLNSLEDKVSIVITFHKKLKTSNETMVQSGTNQRIIPKMSIRHIQLDIQLDIDQLTHKPMKLVQLGRSAYCLEHVSFENALDEANIDKMVNSLISEIFQKD